jgi:thiol:disulfide interchange protein
MHETGWALAALSVTLFACGHAAPPPSSPEPASGAGPAVTIDSPQAYPEIAWIGSPAEARARAADEHKPIVVFVRSSWSKPSVVMDQTIWRDSRVLREASRFVAMRIDFTADYQHLPEAVVKEYGIESVPTTIVLNSDGTMVARWGAGLARPAEVAEAMHRAR